MRKRRDSLGCEISKGGIENPNTRYRCPKFDTCQGRLIGRRRLYSTRQRVTTRCTIIHSLALSTTQERRNGSRLLMHWGPVVQKQKRNSWGSSELNSEQTSVE